VAHSLILYRHSRNIREVVIARKLDAVTRIGFIVRTHMQTEVRMPRLIFQYTITCPNCGSIKTETMPTNACQFFYNCAHCGVRFKPKAGDCCVFCSYGDEPCPPVQEAREKNEVCYCQDTARITDCSNKLERPEFLSQTATDRPRSATTMLLAILALLATGGAFCMFCL
jgi:hypothetical protein